MTDHIRSEELAAYVDGLLSAAGRSALESHIAGCPECLDELADVTALMNGRQEKIPARFLEPVLGEKNKSRRSILPLRLIFETAAALVVVVFIGYLFISGNRFWQTPEPGKPATVMEKDVRRVEPAAAAVRDQEGAPLPAQKREPAGAGKMKGGLGETVDEKVLADRSVLKKSESFAANKDLPKGGVEAASISEPEDKLQPCVEEQAAGANESGPQKKLARTALAPGAAAGATLETAAREKRDASAVKSAFPVRIEGEASISDLRNPELLSAWSWLQAGLALELQIDGAGAVVEAVAVGKFAPLAAMQAELEARKLLFSVSEKKLRRARLVADEKPPN